MKERQSTAIARGRFTDMSDDARYLHLTPADVWVRQKDDDMYAPEAFVADGFIHLTIGETNLMEVANLFYAEDRRDFLVLTLDPSLIDAEVRFDDESGRYPHVYGALNVSAVIAVAAARRAEDGAFLGIS